MAITKLLSSSRDRLIERLKNFSYRHGWVEAHVTNGIAFQIRAMRKAKQWDQKKLAEVALGNAELQPMISRYENPDYGKYSLRTLLDFARAFDVALQVRFAPFSKLIKWEEDLPRLDLAVPSFEAELAKGSLHRGTTTATEARTVVHIVTGTTTSVANEFLRPQVVNLPGKLMRMPVPNTETHHQTGGSTRVN